MNNGYVSMKTGPGAVMSLGNCVCMYLYALCVKPGGTKNKS